MPGDDFSSKSDTQTPERIGGYELLEEVGRGGMGRVYRARSTDGRIVALKMLAPHLTDREIQRKRFFQEAEIAMRLEHPNLVRALEAGEEDGVVYFAMEFVDGVHLGQHLKEVGKIPENEAIRIIFAVARALHKAHQLGLIHRDVKPDNVLLTNDGQVKLADLGLVKELDADLNLTQPDQGLGSPYYMAPEQFRNAVNVDVRCDVYALGQLLYILVTGRLPFKGGSTVDTFLQKTRNEYIRPETITPELSEQTVATICRSIDPYPENRPPTVRDFVEMLAGKQPAKPAPAVPVLKEAPAKGPASERMGAGGAEAANRAARAAAQRTNRGRCVAVSEEFSLDYLIWADRLLKWGTSAVGLLVFVWVLRLATGW